MICEIHGVASGQMIWFKENKSVLKITTFLIQKHYEFHYLFRAASYPTHTSLFFSVFKTISYGGGDDDSKLSGKGTSKETHLIKTQKKNWGSIIYPPPVNV
uniref:Uncharacterized protein n=1 Tax=Eucampia antarctica TaxID=49252 RepID=A0A7S2S164_9STRA|mmetsp:Transcript_29564/g.28431  ORF Transcript_29564/g.28431 Transcript_29564/m.28431 type:complete len:101 (+) Transcript_29564:71-373(+)